ncbi:MAG: hypothetical protein IPH89_08280 [Bacteroidetes bacterium]|nr:hypothetical protein [Bacteroidota bacterium]
MKRIAIIGAGQLGSRHLQALAVSKHPRYTSDGYLGRVAENSRITI